MAPVLRFFRNGPLAVSSLLTSIRARLYAAFGFVALLTVVCSMVGLYAFTTIGDTTTSIVSRSMPATEESLRLAEGASRLLATVPGLMTAEDETTQKKFSGEITQQVRSLAARIDILQKMTDSPTTEIKAAQAAMAERLDALQKARRRPHQPRDAAPDARGLDPAGARKFRRRRFSRGRRRRRDASLRRQPTLSARSTSCAG